MVLVKTPADFIERSLQLLKAHPNTTRITTTYHISPPPSDSSKSRPKPTKPNSTTTTTITEEKPKAPRGKLTLKTYDPISGAIIKLRTDKISDVGRLVAGLHRLGRGMAGLKDLPPVENTPAAGTGEGQQAPAPSVTKDAVAGAVAAVEGESGAAGGSKGGKKKNKKKK